MADHADRSPPARSGGREPVISLRNVSKNFGASRR